MPVEALDGFYVAYFSAADGEGLTLFVIRAGVIVGADTGGFKYDGTVGSVDAGGYEVNAHVMVPPNSFSIMGFTSGQHGLQYDVKFGLPVNLADVPYIEILTPYGTVNMRLVKLRDLGDNSSGRRARR